MSASGIVDAFRATQGSAHRRDAASSARPASSLPVPLGPWIEDLDLGDALMVAVGLDSAWGVVGLTELEATSQGRQIEAAAHAVGPDDQDGFAMSAIFYRVLVDEVGVVDWEESCVPDGEGDDDRDDQGEEDLDDEEQDDEHDEEECLRQATGIVIEIQRAAGFPAWALEAEVEDVQPGDEEGGEGNDEEPDQADGPEDDADADDEEPETDDDDDEWNGHAA